MDTHAFIWHLLQSSDLSPMARTMFTEGDAGLRRILVPNICVVETIYLTERGRVAPGLVDTMLSYVRDDRRPYRLVGLDAPVVEAVRRVPRSVVPDMPDRIITATALAFGLPLVSVDERIRAANVVEVIW